jgi:metal-responsive CopG/Arc/MetJ family transcriptional regulator
MVTMQDHIAVGISLPKEILTRIDTERGDVSRSRFLLRKLEKMFDEARGVNK